jgi:PAS domain-containing protein
MYMTPPIGAIAVVLQEDGKTFYNEGSRTVTIPLGRLEGRALDDKMRRAQHSGDYFLPPGRVSAEELRRTIESVSKNPVMDGILANVSGLLAVLNPQRQILAVNHALLTALGVEEGDRLLGLRPGEAIQCLHADEGPDGCGTGKFCSTCGAAIAMVAALAENGPAERECAISAERDGKPIDFYFQVRCSPVVVEDERFFLLFLRDISAEQQRGALERVFYHDVANLLEGLLAQSRSLDGPRLEGEDRSTAEHIERLALRLASEVKIQRALSRGPDDLGVSIRSHSPARTLHHLEETFRHHPAAQGKSLRIAPVAAELRLSTDPNLLERVLMNLLTNAFEATPGGGEVRLWMEDEEETVSFCVWNCQHIPEEIARRVFQRNFTTKEGGGRGLGAFAAKLLGETYLGGQVGFTTSEAEGTLFRLSLPKHGQPADRIRD